MTKRAVAFASDERGASMAEYVILVAVVAMMALGAFRLFGLTLGVKVLGQALTVVGL